MAGLYDSPDLSSLMAAFQPDKDAARRMAALDAGFALLGGQGIGQAGLYAMQGYQNALEQQQRQAIQRMQATNSALALQQTVQNLRDQSTMGEAIKGTLSGAPPQTPMQNAMAAAPSLSPTNANVASVTQAAAAQAAQQAPSQYQAMLAQADAIDRAIQQPNVSPTAAVKMAAYARQIREEALKFAPQYDGTETVMQNGQPVLYQKFKNQPGAAVPGFQPKPEYKLVNTGQSQQFIDPLTGQVGGTFQNQMTPGEIASNAIAQGQLRVAQANEGINAGRLGVEQENANLKRVQLDPFGVLGINKTPGTATSAAIGNGLHGPDFLAQLPGGDTGALASQVKALAEGRMAFPSGFAMRSPQAQALLQLVGQYDPTFDAVNYGARAKMRASAVSGPMGQSINALNTVAGHMSDLAAAADNLNNTRFPLVNSVVNATEQALGDPRMQTFDATKKAVVDELTRAYRGAGGSEKDIQTWSQAINTSNSPAQFKAVLGQIAGLLESKIGALSAQYSQGMGTTEQPFQFVTPKARAAFDALEAGKLRTNPADVRARADAILGGK